MVVITSKLLEIFIFMYFRISKFYRKTKKRRIQKTEILYINEGKEIYKTLCCVTVNCISRSEKGIRLFKFPADNIQ